jgi:outer membrane protein insertion porin family
MLKFFTKIILFVFLIISKSYSENIKDIKINGNQRISKETIIVLGKININEDYNDNKLNETLKNLYSTNFFNNISINIENEILTVSLTENPIIEDIKITGIKNKSIVKELTEIISLKNRTSFTEDQLSLDINRITNALKSGGYYFTKITPSIYRNEKLNSVELIIDVSLGDKAKIKKISFIGDKKVKDKRLLSVIASEEHKFWKFVSSKVYLNQSLINLDVRLLLNYYKNLGYYKAKVNNSFAEFDEKGFFKLIFNVDAGDQYFFNDLKLNLPDDYNIEDFNELNKIFVKLKGKKYSIDDLNSILKEIDKIASIRLYDFIDAEVKEQVIDNKKINFTFNIVDSKKFYVERINIFGNFTTIEEVIRNKLVVDEGDPLNTLLYNKSIDNIKSLRIFKNVKGEIKDGKNDNLKILDITVEEQPTGEIALAAGIGTNGTTIGGGLNEKNFLGKGINLITDLEISQETVKGKFVYSKPNFAYTDNTLFTSIEATSTDLLSDFGYKVSKNGFSLGTEVEQFENLFFAPEVTVFFEDLETNSTASTQLKRQKGKYEDVYLNYSLNYDLRNSKFKPSSGNKIQFFQELPMISDINEISNTFVFTQYKTLSQSTDMIGKASLYLKAVNSLDGSDVRISKRASVPYHRLRGFEKGKVGPIDNSDFIGGNYISALNLSTNLPSLLPTVENVDFSYFIDIANIWGVDYSDTLDDKSKLRSSTGIALDLLTPVGPLSFSLSKAITKQSTDKTESFRFNLGTTF